MPLTTFGERHSVHLEIGSGGEAAFLIEMVWGGGVNGSSELLELHVLSAGSFSCAGMAVRILRRLF
jgi:hypothetical protein